MDYCFILSLMVWYTYIFWFDSNKIITYYYICVSTCLLFILDSYLSNLDLNIIEKRFNINYMSNIHVLYEMSFGFFTGFLDILAVLSIFLGIFIIVAKNPIVSVLYLILLFSSISCYLIFIGIKFIGISYLLVYVGAVSILFLFILMLINIRVSELISDTKNNLPLATIISIAFFIPFSNLLPDAKAKLNVVGFDFNNILEYVINNKQVSYVSSKNWDGNLLDSTDIMSIGNVMYTSYSIWLLITSIILLLSMVGSIVITIKQKY